VLIESDKKIVMCKHPFLFFKPLGVLAAKCVHFPFQKDIRFLILLYMSYSMVQKNVVSILPCAFFHRLGCWGVCIPWFLHCRSDWAHGRSSI